jgi:hypothetical protein
MCRAWDGAEASCINHNDEGTLAVRYYAVATAKDCTGTSTLTFQDETDMTEAACAAVCHDKHADYFSWGTAGSSGFCYCYTGACDVSGSAAAKNVFSIENVCYYTTPRQVHASSDCSNAATVNAGIDAALITFATNWDLYTCHWECQ